MADLIWNSAYIVFIQRLPDIDSRSWFLWSRCRAFPKGVFARLGSEVRLAWCGCKYSYVYLVVCGASAHACWLRQLAAMPLLSATRLALLSGTVHGIYVWRCCPSVYTHTCECEHSIGLNVLFIGSAFQLRLCSSPQQSIDVVVVVVVVSWLIRVLMLSGSEAICGHRSCYFLFRVESLKYISEECWLPINQGLAIYIYIKTKAMGQNYKCCNSF